MAGGETVYDHIWKNNVKTVFLLFIFVAMAIIIVWCGVWAGVYLESYDKKFIIDGVNNVVDMFPSITDRINETNGIFYATLGYFIPLIIPIIVISILWLLFIYFFGRKSLLYIVGARQAQEGDYKKLYNSVENVAIMAGLPTPKVFVIEDESMNAFTIGTKPEDAVVVFSTGIVEKLTPSELQGVIAHEMAHIGNHDLLLNLMLIESIGIFSFLADLTRCFILTSDRRSRKSESPYTLILTLVVFSLQIFSIIVAPIIYLMISRTREYNADATGAKIIHNPEALANALYKIASDPRIEKLGAAFSSTCIADHRYSSAHLAEKGSLFSTHPPIQERIRRLKNMA